MTGPRSPSWSFPPPAQLAAVELLLRLVVPGDAPDGSQDSVRTTPAEELYGERPANEHRPMWQAVAGLAAAGVLVVGSDDSVRPVSAALLPARPRLRGAVAGDRAGLAVHRTVGQAARAWMLAAVVGGDSVQLWDVEALIALGLPVTPTGRRIDAMTLGNGVLRTLSGAGVTSVDLSPDRVAAGICDGTGRDITREEWETYVPDASYRSLC
ncbi:hypothetical protein AB0903_23830 [Streptomyces sp. NPDC048389]|uniref:nSTAND1 domain-containing NTPase n=1 Tax=Streptomyces sp. NPDC048389 TaxID=3154622 RepID=UPI0034555156